MKIFISYSSADKAKREEISEYLEDLGHNVWADKSLKSGQEWWNEILEEVRQAQVFITLLSKNYDASEACDYELRYALALNKYVLPIKIEALSNELLPYELGKLQILGYYSLSDSKRITRLVNALSAIENQTDYPRENPASLPKEPAIPISYKTRIFNRLDIKDELDVASQKEIISELRKAIQNNQKDHSEIKALLEKMQKRGDEIRLNTSYEINELLEKIDKQNNTKENLATEPEPQYFSTSSNHSPTQEQSISSTDEKLSIGLQILAVFMPIAGFVMFYIYKDEAKPKANRAIILAIVGMVFYLALGGSDNSGYVYY